MNELQWCWAYMPYLDMPSQQAESATKAGYVKVVFKSEADRDLLKEKRKRCLAMAKSCKNAAELFSCMAYHERSEFGKTPAYNAYSLTAAKQSCHRKKWLKLAAKLKEAIK